MESSYRYKYVDINIIVDMKLTPHLHKFHLS